MATTDWTKSQPDSNNWSPAAAPNTTDWAKSLPGSNAWETQAPTTEPGNSSLEGSPIGLLLVLTYTTTAPLVTEWAPASPATANWTPATV